MGAHAINPLLVIGLTAVAVIPAIVVPITTSHHTTNNGKPVVGPGQGCGNPLGC